MTTLRARYDGKVLIPEGSVDLPEGSILELQVLNSSSATAGASDTVGKLRRAMGAPPRLDPADVDALDDAIEQGRLPVDELGPFHDR